MISVAFTTDCPDKLRIALSVIAESGLPCHMSTPPPALAIREETETAGPNETEYKRRGGERVKFTAGRQAQYGTREAFFASLLADMGACVVSSPPADMGATYDGPDETDAEGGDPDSF